MKRILSIGMFVALMFVGLSIAGSVRASDNQLVPVTIHAQGSAYHVDFTSILGKRADLRSSVASNGLDAAFTMWLKAEHPDSYKSAVASYAANPKPNTDPRFAKTYCCESSGACCNSGCAQCCAKGPCKMGCCEMKQCKSIGNACCR